MTKERVLSSCAEKHKERSRKSSKIQEIISKRRIRCGFCKKCLMKDDDLIHNPSECKHFTFTHIG